MATSPRVSVVMPAHNEERHIDAAIESIREQTYGDFEAVVVDDGSADATADRIAAHASADDRVRVLTHDTNQGLPAARNTALAAARGGYVAVMDADDKSHPERLAAQVRFLDANPHTHAVGTHARYLDREGSPIGTWECAVAGKDTDALRRDGPDIPHAATMLRRSSIEAVGGYREPFDRSDDLDLWVRLAREFGRGFASVIPRPLFDYRLTPGLFGRRRVDRIYGSYAGDLVGREEELAERIAADLDAAETDTDPARQTAMYHLRIGRAARGDGRHGRAVREFVAGLRADPVWASKRIGRRLRGRLIG